jgi:uncharacterized membrane protein YagU involved in acid resistance
MLFFYSQIFKKYLNKVVWFNIKMATGFILSIAITLALGMLLVPAIGTVVFAENMTGKDSNMTGKDSNMTGMASNMTGNMTGMIGNMTG